MARWVAFALIALPIVEIAVLIRMIASVGLLVTIVLLLLAASLGLRLLRTQGLEAWLRVQGMMARGQSPATEILESGLVGLGGVLLLVPGFVTDLLALVCLIPFLRRWIVGFLVRRGLGEAGGKPGEAPGPITIEGEFRREQ